MIKTCSVCGNNDVRIKGMCTKCYIRQYNRLNTTKKRKRKWEMDHPGRKKIWDTRYKRKNGVLPMSENRNCPVFLGVHVAERVLEHVFDDVIKQPYQNHGFDFICNKGKKIDVKSACLYYGTHQTPNWHFDIRKNKLADYFLCLAFDNRKDLSPMYMWLIPGADINSKCSASVSINRIFKWDKYSIPTNNVYACCGVLKSQ